MPLFREFLNSKFALDRAFSNVADTTADTSRSDVLIYENGKPLGPPHSTHANVGNIGHVAFLIGGLLDVPVFLERQHRPQKNGRGYWAVSPIRSLNGHRTQASAMKRKRIWASI
jgi:hypothetical protein